MYKLLSFDKTITVFMNNYKIVCKKLLPIVVCIYLFINLLTTNYDLQQMYIDQIYDRNWRVICTEKVQVDPFSSCGWSSTMYELRKIRGKSIQSRTLAEGSLLLGERSSQGEIA